jgi:hypothetical protein
VIVAKNDPRGILKHCAQNDVTLVKNGAADASPGMVEDGQDPVAAIEVKDFELLTQIQLVIVPGLHQDLMRVTGRTNPWPLGGFGFKFISKLHFGHCVYRFRRSNVQLLAFWQIAILLVLKNGEMV